MKPDFVSQTAEPTTGDERRAWLKARSEEAHAEGTSFQRAAVKELGDRTVVLFEAWKERPPHPWPEPQFHLQVTA